MPTLISTPKAANANAYVDLARALVLLAERLYTPEWATATQADQESSIIWATYFFDRAMDWHGSKRTVEQSLRHPRSGLVNEDGDNYDFDTISLPLEKATANLSFEFVKRNLLATPGLLGQGFSRTKIDVIDITVDPTQLLDFVPDYILVSLDQIGTLRPSVRRGGSSVLGLERT